ncbi:MAG: hypothetical protein WC436_01565 [Candidatus Babeliales bacterium]
MNFYKNFFQKLFLSVFIFSNFLSFNYIFSYTNKTYLRQLDHSFIKPTKDTFSDFIKKQYDFYNLDKQSTFKFNLGLSGFYFQSTNGSQMGRYFGVNEKNNIIVDFANTNDVDVLQGYLIHWPAVAAGITNVNLSPKTTQLGLDLIGTCDLSKIIKNLFLKLNVPILYIKNDLRAKFTPSGYDADEDSSVLSKYLSGNYQDLTTNDRKQVYLEYSKINGSKSKTGCSDIDLYIGYLARESDSSNIVLKFGVTIPVSNKPKGEFLFEPILGNSGQWAINLGFDGYVNLFEQDKHKLNLLFDLTYKYLFDNNQKRILSIKGANWGQYYLLGKNGTQDPLIPAANLITQNVKVSGLNQIDGDLNLLYNYSNFGAMLGLGLLFRQDEHLRFKDSFVQDTYAIANPGYDMNTHAFDQNYSDYAFGSYWLNNKNLDLSSAQSEQVVSYKINGNLGYIFNFENSFLIDLRLGGAYIFAPRNSNFSGFSIDLTANFCF